MCWGSKMKQLLCFFSYSFFLNGRGRGTGHGRLNCILPIFYISIHTTTLHTFFGLHCQLFLLLTLLLIMFCRSFIFAKFQPETAEDLELLQSSFPNFVIWLMGMFIVNVGTIRMQGLAVTGCSAAKLCPGKQTMHGSLVECKINVTVGTTVIGDSPMSVVC